MNIRGSSSESCSQPSASLAHPEVLLDIVDVARVRFSVEHHGHDQIDRFGNVAMSAWLKATFYKLQSMLDIGKTAHTKEDAEFGAFISKRTVRLL